MFQLQSWDSQQSGNVPLIGRPAPIPVQMSCKCMLYSYTQMLKVHMHLTMTTPHKRDEQFHSLDVTFEARKTDMQVAQLHSHSSFSTHHHLQATVLLGVDNIQPLNFISIIVCMQFCGVNS